MERAGADVRALMPWLASEAGAATGAAATPDKEGPR
jgi:hypothetical protein